METLCLLHCWLNPHVLSYAVGWVYVLGYQSAQTNSPHLALPSMLVGSSQSFTCSPRPCCTKRRFPPTPRLNQSSMNDSFCDCECNTTNITRFLLYYMQEIICSVHMRQNHHVPSKSADPTSREISNKKQRGVSFSAA